MRTLLALLLAAVQDQSSVAEGPRKTNLLPPAVNNPRNSEGDFLPLKDGLLLFVYTKFTGGTADHARAHLAARYSGDAGRTWSPRDKIVVENEGKQNVMSVSLLRLPAGPIALFYLRKDSDEECRMFMRLSEDEGNNWGEPAPCMPGPGYYVVNNDRVVALKSGRIVIPASLRNLPGGKSFPGIALSFLSDDQGKTWRRGKGEVAPPEGSRSGLQEPLVVELKDGRLLMLCRTDQGCHFRSYSSDGGETWSAAERSNLVAPLSPASVARIPSTGDLLVVWNDHSDVDEAHRGKRTPLRVAISRDEGRTWEKTKTIEDDPDGWYCYTAIHFADDRVVLAYCAGDSTIGRLSRTRMTGFEIAWLYK
jgi:Neuraminidase (sialidase)